MECKGGQVQHRSTAQAGINRTILECKVRILFPEFQHGGRINRTILECKVICRRCVIHNAIVLIEPYWNVKRESTSESMDFTSVLIEPYWNVKIYPNSGLMDLILY